MLTRAHLLRRTQLVVLAVLAASTLGIAACTSGSSNHMPGMPGMSSGAMPSGSPISGMPGMDGDQMAAGDGLASSMSGFTFAPAATALRAGAAQSFAFQIHGADARAVTSFVQDQTKLMHFYLIRSDLTGFQHVHPVMAADGTWTAALAPLQPGTYRAYASFIAKEPATGKPTPLVLSNTVTVPGPATATPLPSAASTTQVDGYTLAVGGQAMMANMTHMLTVTVSRNGIPVTDLQPYLDTYAHLTALHQTDLAFAHLHPQGTVAGDHGGPTLTFAAMLPRAGNWRLFVQFQTAGVVHTGEVTVPVG